MRRLRGYAVARLRGSARAFLTPRNRATAQVRNRAFVTRPPSLLASKPPRSVRRSFVSLLGGQEARRLGGYLAAAFVLMLLAANTASACPVCYGAPGDPMVKGTNNGVWVLLGIVGFVQAGFVALFWSFWRRARALKKFRDQFHVIEGGPHP